MCDETISQKITELTSTILDDYSKGRTIDASCPYDQPDKKVIIDMINKLQIIVFPGHFKNYTYKVYTRRSGLSMLLEDVMFNLKRQIASVLGFDEKYADLDCDGKTDKAAELALEFLERIPKIREFIETDVQAGFDGDPAAFNKDEIIYSYPGLYAIFVNRIAHELFLLGVPMIPRIMTEHAHSLTGIDIHPGASIGKYFFIDHGTGIVIGETTEIGDNVKIYQGVTLGALSTRGGQSLRNKKRHPTIMDNVTIYSGASILGGDTVIGRDVVIGGNAFITKSIAAGAKVSIKNQELRYNYDSKHPVEQCSIDEEAEWFYII
ncbi:serine acetyltransferase [Ruminococcus sp. NK3A76]|uniref:serine O-acetyltransferase n=1 Tax=Ruminococcus sp. NK3A76 TaxID=877411 RepID=UPI000491096B|nr:serine acetyltransferase [Ruminococcus sp. NK3A76]